MSEGNLDLSRVVNIIMENPALLEEIAKMAKNGGEERSEDRPISEEKAAPTQATPSTYRGGYGRDDRARLLDALKPYVSPQRAKAIDSMISIADILDVMKTR